MLLERFLNVVQTILTQNPKKNFGLRPDHGFPPPNEKSQPIRGGKPKGGGTYGYRLMCQVAWWLCQVAWWFQQEAGFQAE